MLHLSVPAQCVSSLCFWTLSMSLLKCPSSSVSASNGRGESGVPELARKMPLALGAREPLAFGGQSLVLIHHCTLHRPEDAGNKPDTVESYILGTSLASSRSSGAEVGVDPTLPRWPSAARVCLGPSSLFLSSQLSLSHGRFFQCLLH